MTLAILPWRWDWGPEAGAPGSTPTRGAPYTGFGTVPFGFLRDEATGTLPDWQEQSFVNTRHVPGGNVNKTQLLGLGPGMLTCRISLDSMADYRRLKALRQTTGVLTMIASVTSAEGDYEHVHGIGYVLIPDVTLLNVGANAVIELNGVVDVDATFQKPSA